MSDTPKDLPKDAGHRLEELEHGLFTSDLSVNEFLLVKEAGFHPLGFVMGSSIYHTGIQTRKWGQSQELTKLT
ncbi:MAG: heavy metal-binding domain-containing protein, partial [Acidimicrobiales bacterium]